MIIYTTTAQDSTLQDWYRQILRAHHDDGCEPPGFTLEIELGLPSHYGISATAVCGSQRLELGDVEVKPG